MAAEVQERDEHRDRGFQEASSELVLSGFPALPVAGQDVFGALEDQKYMKVSNATLVT